MDRSKETTNTWNKIADLYAEKFMDLELYNDSYDLFCELISEAHPNILDIGCGPGNITKYLLKKRPDFNMLGIDNAPNMIRLAKKHSPTTSFQVMDARHIISLPPGFHGMMCGFCIPYLSKKEVSKLLSDSFHLLQNNGILYLSFLDDDYAKSGYKTGSTGDKVYFYYYTTSFLVDALRKHHFDILHRMEFDYKRSENTSEKHTVLIAKKVSAKV